MFEYEFEMEHEGEQECEFASEYESEQFLPILGGLAATFAPDIIKGIGGLISKGKKKRRRGKRRRSRRPRGYRGRGRQREFEAEFETEYKVDPYIVKLLKNWQSGQRQSEGEYEYEYELAIAPINEYELEMENFAYEASQSESEAEAEAFLGALVPVAARLFPKTSSQAIASVTPSLIEGVATMAQVLHQSPKARPLMRTVPHILHQTVKTLANHTQQGKPISRTIALRMLAGNTAKVLDNPLRIAQVMKKSHRAQHLKKATNNGKRRPALTKL